MKKLLYFLLPLLELRSSENKINKDIEKVIQGEISLTDTEIKKLDKTDLETFYNSSFDTKKIIEDKAKLGIIGITITIGLAYSITSNYDKLSDFSLTLSIIALAYSLMAGYLTLKVIGDKNIIYTLQIRDLLLELEDKKTAYISNYILNTKINTIRQNYVYSIYKHIVYAVIIIIVAFISNIFLYKKAKSNQKNNVVECNISIKNDKTILLLERTKTNQDTISILKSDLNDTIITIENMKQKPHQENNESNNTNK